MDLLAELESMAVNVASEEDITNADLERWQKLFGFSMQEARQELERFRADLARTSVSNEVWSGLAAEQMALGLDKESFEYSLTYEHRKPRKQSSAPDGVTRSTYIIKLEGPLSSAQQLQSALGTQCPPNVLEARNEEGEDQNGQQAFFCKLSALERITLLEYIATNHPCFQPTIVRLAKADKSLGTHSKAPCLGSDMKLTLPQFRQCKESTQRPAQNEYPVWYFFYGKLADPNILRSLLELEDNPILVPAQIRGGKIKIWGGRYNAMVDATMEDVVVGSAFKVMSQKQEEALQFFETDMYEIVRCSIVMDASHVDGLVFRFCGPEVQLSG